ncbi:unnamed protein product [Pleuronectes platessa]|uniref:Uncharacterized protein n=1 Tax=Pleuronectes platessa TaxID=8262 RepID=A0A9N7UBC6_PLEPL|nr:unnamed protein product [Pleuronectes platessa]
MPPLKRPPPTPEPLWRLRGPPRAQQPPQQTSFAGSGVHPEPDGFQYTGPGMGLEGCGIFLVCPAPPQGTGQNDSPKADLSAMLQQPRSPPGSLTCSGFPGENWRHKNKRKKTQVHWGSRGAEAERQGPLGTREIRMRDQDGKADRTAGHNITLNDSG